MANNQIIIDIVKSSIEKIKDELLLFAICSILISVTFPQYRLSIFLLFCLASISYLLKIFLKSKKSYQNNNHLKNFSKFILSKKKWDKRLIDDFPIYYYSKNNNYRIEQAQDTNKTWSATENWMKVFPDKSIFEYKVYLKYGETKIKELLFVSCDGARYFIPLPERKVIQSDEKSFKSEFYWVKDSIEYHVGEIIGTFYRFNNLEQVADFCKVKIVN